MSPSAVETFFDIVKKRRSVYTIDDNDPKFSTAQIEFIVEQALDTCPSPWNIKSSTCLIVTGKHHKRLFNGFVMPALEATLQDKAFEKMKDKVQGLAAGIGTVLFFENQNIWDKLAEKNPRTKPMVEPWSNVVTGMIQYAVWTALSVADFGCSLQHFDWNEDIVQQVHSEFGVPESWQLKAQLVFGHKTEEPGKVPFEPYASKEERRHCRVRHCNKSASNNRSVCSQGQVE